VKFSPKCQVLKPDENETVAMYRGSCLPLSPARAAGPGEHLPWGTSPAQDQGLGVAETCLWTLLLLHPKQVWDLAVMSSNPDWWKSLEA